MNIFPALSALILIPLPCLHGCKTTEVERPKNEGKFEAIAGTWQPDKSKIYLPDGDPAKSEAIMGLLQQAPDIVIAQDGTVKGTYEVVQRVTKITPSTVEIETKFVGKDAANAMRQMNLSLDSVVIYKRGKDSTKGEYLQDLGFRYYRRK
jgi:hypothetical protein